MTKHSQSKYGWEWDGNATDLDIELQAMRWKGHWRANKQSPWCGLGLFQHFRNAMTLCWPEDDHHRWSDLVLQHYLAEQITVVMGGRDSSKTRTASKIALLEYWLFPHETLIMVSSTDSRGADYRVWGDLKSLLTRAKERWPWLEGIVMEGRRAIFTDSVDQGQVRDPRKGLVVIPCLGSGGQWLGMSRFVGIKQKRRRLIGDECFPAGTCIDTPMGPRPIESLRAGDLVLNTGGFGRIVGVGYKEAETLWRIRTKDQREIVCTPDHEFLTQLGWIRACNLERTHYVLPTHEARRKERRFFKGAWVESSEFIKPQDFERYRTSKEGATVYNLHVEAHHDYSVNGLVASNCQFMRGEYLDIFSNLQSGDFKGMFLGQPIGDDDPLDKLSEPIAGWGSEGEIKKTATWRNKFGGVTINLVGIDSPNFDFPQVGGGKRYPYIIGQKDIDQIANQYGKDSGKYWMQAMGVRRPGILSKRVITAQLCEQHHALEPCVWSGGPTTMIAGLDAAYGGVGGDRCVLQVCEFGQGIPLTEAEKPSILVLPMGAAEERYQQLFKVYQPVIVPVSVADTTATPEEQIARFCKSYCTSNGIPPSNFFFDARATLAVALAQNWSPQVNAIEFGGAATKRPVSNDHWVYDQEMHQRRLKRCDEEYSKFVSELWWAIRLIIVTGQMRNLPLDVMREGCQREWRFVRGDRHEVETKAEMRERTNRSPDLFDALAICGEGARRRGFQIGRLANVEASTGETQWVEDLQTKQRELFRRRELIYTS